MTSLPALREAVAKHSYDYAELEACATALLDEVEALKAPTCATCRFQSDDGKYCWLHNKPRCVAACSRCHGCDDWAAKEQA